MAWPVPMAKCSALWIDWREGGHSETSVLVVPGVKDTKSGHLEYPDLVSFKKVCHTVKKAEKKKDRKQINGK